MKTGFVASIEARLVAWDPAMGLKGYVRRKLHSLLSHLPLK